VAARRLGRETLVPGLSRAGVRRTIIAPWWAGSGGDCGTRRGLRLRGG